MVDLDDFAPIERAFDAIEGMTSAPSALLFHLFLRRQNFKGPMLEIGPYKGKSAIVLAHHLRDGETLDLVDRHPYLDTQAFESFGDQVRLHIGDCEHLRDVLPDFARKRGAYRFIHSDASHTFDNVVSDLRYADQLLHEEGGVSVDDYENPNYPQVPLAVGKAIYGDKVRLALFLISNNKAYLCRPARRGAMMRDVVNVIAPAMRMTHSFIIAYTDQGEHAPISLRPQEARDEGSHIYAPQLYGHFVEQITDA